MKIMYFCPTASRVYFTGLEDLQDPQDYLGNHENHVILSVSGFEALGFHLFPPVLLFIFQLAR